MKGELSQKEKTNLTDQVGDLFATLIVDKGFCFRSAKREIRQTVTSFVGHVWLD